MMMPSISAAQITALVAASLMLMLVGRNWLALRIPARKAFGMALVWVAVFGVVVMIAAQFEA